jgi:hypothetical protein
MALVGKTEDEDELEDDYDFGTRAIKDGTIYEVGAGATQKKLQTTQYFQCCCLAMAILFDREKLDVFCFELECDPVFLRRSLQLPLSPIGLVPKS